MNTATCLNCGDSYSRTHHLQKYCRDAECVAYMQKKKCAKSKAKKRAARLASINPQQCVKCGAEFTATRVRKHCTHTCKTGRMSNCANCGDALQGTRNRKYCEGTACLADRNRKAAKIHSAKYSAKKRAAKLDSINPQQCKQCGEGFTADRVRKYCTEICRSRYSKGVAPDYVKPPPLTEEQKRVNKSALNKAWNAKARLAQGCRLRADIAAETEAKKAEQKQQRKRRVWASLWLRYDETKSEKYRRRYREDKEFRLKEIMRSQVRKSERRDSIENTIRSGLKKGSRSRTVEAALGFTIKELAAHIERLFTDGMSWELFFSGAIHLDHKMPRASYDLTDQEQWRECWSLDNLQPLWAEDNRWKGSKVVSMLSAARC